MGMAFVSMEPHLYRTSPNSFKGTYFSSSVDAYSKWMEVKITNSIRKSSHSGFTRDLCQTSVIVRQWLLRLQTSKTSQSRMASDIHWYVTSYHPTFNSQAKQIIKEVKKILSKLGKGDVTSKLRVHRIEEVNTTGIELLDWFGCV